MFDFESEKKKLNRIIKAIPKDKKDLVEGLIADASFMAEQLDKLRQHITENGWSEEYQNGANQSGRKTSVEADMYVKLQKAYASIIRQLTEFLPSGKEDTVNIAGEALAKFVAGGKPKA